MKPRRGEGRPLTEEGPPFSEVRTYQLILIGSHGGEDRLRVDERLELLLLQVQDGGISGGVRPLDQVDPRLVLVHRVQDELRRKRAHVKRSARFRSPEPEARRFSGNFARERSIKFPVRIRSDASDQVPRRILT